MNKKEAKHLGEVMLAWVEGKTIQLHTEGKGWQDISEGPVGFVCNPEEYRIKLILHTKYMNTIIAANMALYNTKEAAELARSAGYTTVKIEWEE